MLNRGSPFEVTEVLCDLSLIQTEKELSFGRRSLLDEARTLLVAELALARRCMEARVQDEIDQLLAP